MLQLLRRWFRLGRPEAASTAADAPPAALTGEGSARESAPDAPPRAAAPAPPTASGVRAVAHEALRTAVAELRRALPAAEGDAHAVLDRVADGPSPDLRQIPAAAQQVLAATQSDSLSREALVRLVERDPAIAQAVLRAANSAAFRGAAPAAAALGPALGRLGMANVRAIVLQQAVVGLISRPGGDLDRMASMVWAHMTDTAIIARAIAPGFGADPDEAFAAALLHDAGKLVLFDACSQLRVDRRRPVAIASDTLASLLRALHEPLGALAADAWAMPPHVVEAIGTHHRGALADGTRAPLAETLFVAERADLARRRSAPYAVEAWWDEGRLTGSAVRVAAALDGLPR